MEGSLGISDWGFWKMALLRGSPLCGAATEGFRREGAGAFWIRIRMKIKEV
jgi:hypothetical protein